ncbi:MAG: hypothetical protein ACYC4L_03950 [Chloroflexota bacterium]
MFKYQMDPTQWSQETDHREVNRTYNEYRRYLESVKDQLPSSAYEFATAPWHWDVEDHRTLHDSWVESLSVSEVHPEDNVKQRGVTIAVRLLGPYHDIYTDMTYLEVSSYSLTLPRLSSVVPAWSQVRTRHDDWLGDEVRVTDDNRIEHEIVFGFGGRWLIECTDIRIRWTEIRE